MVYDSLDLPQAYSSQELIIKRGLGFVYNNAPIIYNALAVHPQLLDQETGRVLIHRYISEPTIHILEGDEGEPQHLYLETNTYLSKPHDDGGVELWEEQIIGKSEGAVETRIAEVEDIIATDLLRDDHSSSSPPQFDEVLDEIQQSPIQDKRINRICFKFTQEGIQKGTMTRQIFPDPEVVARASNLKPNTFIEQKLGIGSAELEIRVKDFGKMFTYIIETQKLKGVS